MLALHEMISSYNARVLILSQFAKQLIFTSVLGRIFWQRKLSIADNNLLMSFPTIFCVVYKKVKAYTGATFRILELELMKIKIAKIRFGIANSRFGLPNIYIEY